MTGAMLRNLLKSRECAIYCLIALFPLLLLVVGLMRTNFMQLSAPRGSLSMVSFYGAALSIQNQMVLPSVVIIYLATVTFRTEIDNGLLFLYKDVGRGRVFAAKTWALLGVYGCYVAVLFASSALTYVTYVVRQPYASGTFLPRSGGDLRYAGVEILGNLLVGILVVLLAEALSVLTSSGVTMLVAVLFLLVSVMAPNLRLLRWLLPNGYVGMADNLPWAAAFGGMVLTFLAFAAAFLVVGRRAFCRLEF